eukprot:TRINITY_DN3467_c0_g1_i2.p1 TRINITY_DN3467_c0_g1~~TRINITY_DN3467_c0_g1_i2.p1  ORF type:complete len:503 (-),score=95.59 TRINITY_DN3467_c0_g1_i2:62-1570(-)
MGHISAEQATEETSELPVSVKVPLRVKLSYAAVNFTLELQATIWALFALHFMTNNAKIRPDLAGWIAVLYRIWDALDDPVIGTLSDKTKSSKWGRRRGWMLVGIFPFALAYFAMWYVPFAPENQVGLFIYFLAVKMISDLGYTCVNVPHFALLNDIAPDYHERFQINSIRTIGIAAGSLLSMVLVFVLSLIFPGKDQEQTKFLVLAGVTCTFSIASVVNCVFQTKDYNTTRPSANALAEKSLKFFTRFKHVFSVKAAALAIGIFVLSTSATQATLAMATYLMKDYLLMDDLRLVSVILTAQVIGIVTAATMTAVQKRVEKRTVYFIGVSVWLIFYLLVGFITPSTKWMIYPLALIMGIGMATAMLIPMSFVSDSAEFIDHKTGLRLEGTLFGSLHLINKSTVGLVIFSFEHIIDASGFNPLTPTDMQPQTVLSLKLCFALIPSALLAGSMALNYFVPISRASTLAIAAALKDREQKSDSAGLLSEEKDDINFTVLDDLSNEN